MRPPAPSDGTLREEPALSRLRGQVTHADGTVRMTAQQRAELRAGQAQQSQKKSDFQGRDGRDSEDDCRDHWDDSSRPPGGVIDGFKAVIEGSVGMSLGSSSSPHPSDPPPNGQSFAIPRPTFGGRTGLPR